jgi:hypothetical protein
MSVVLLSSRICPSAVRCRAQLKNGMHEMGKKDGIQRRSFCPVIIVGKTMT